MSVNTTKSLVDLKRLRYIVEAARAGSVTAASRVLAITQPALTRNIAEVEEELGIQIFHRLPTGIVLTEEGEEFVNRSRIILDDVATLCLETKKRGDEPAGRLRVGFSPAGYIYSLTEVMGEFAARYPEISIETVTGTPQSVCPRLIRGELDLIIGSSGYFRRWPDLRVTNLAPLEFACMVKKNHPAVGNNDLTEKEMLSYPLVLPESVDAVYSDLATRYTANGLPAVSARYVTDDMTLVISLLNSTDAFYPLNTIAEVMDFLRADLKMISGVVEFPQHFVCISTMKHRPATAAASAFVDMVTRALVASKSPARESQTFKTALDSS